MVPTAHADPDDPTREMVLAARQTAAAWLSPTPLLESAWLSRVVGRPVWLKCESLQRTGCFKPRGALAALARWDPERRARGVLDASAGNHGLGLAFAARALSMPCTIVVPRSVPRIKAERMRELGARLVEAPGSSFDEARLWMLARRAELPGEVPGPADEAALMAGGGVIALEALDALPGLGALLVPAGWGGLAIGCAVAAAGACAVHAVNSDASPGLHRWVTAGRAPTAAEELPTWAEGLQGGTTARTGRLARQHLSGVLLAREATIRRAARELLLRERLLVEPSGAAAVAALLDGRAPPGGGPLAVVLTGGNADPQRIAEILSLAEPSPS